MNKTLKRALISVAVAIAVYWIGDYVAGYYGSNYNNLGQVYLAAVIAGGCYWLGSKE